MYVMPFYMLNLSDQYVLLFDLQCFKPISILFQQQLFDLMPKRLLQLINRTVFMFAVHPTVPVLHKFISSILSKLHSGLQSEWSDL